MSAVSGLDEGGELLDLGEHLVGDLGVAAEEVERSLYNGILGAIFGLGEGAVFAFFIAWLLRFGGMLLKPEVVEETILLKWLQSVNPLVEFFGL